MVWTEGVRAGLVATCPTKMAMENLKYRRFSFQMDTIQLSLLYTLLNALDCNQRLTIGLIRISSTVLILSTAAMESPKRILNSVPE